MWAWIKRVWFKLLLVCLVATAAYAWYLDAQVRPHFAGNKWQVPAQIFARPLVLKVKEFVSLNEVKQELQLLGYRQVSSPAGPGEYTFAANTLVVYRRAFAFADGAVPERLIRISWQGDRIIDLRDERSGQQLRETRLEPWMITRLLPENKEDRMLVRLEDIPDILVQALLLIEDRDFYQHYGIDPMGIARALVTNLRAGRTVQGGSTLTQQLVKNLYLTRSQTIWRKLNEALIAVIIELRYSKDDILQAYFNEVFVGQKGGKAIHGMGLAAYYYFDRPLNELATHELATLVGLLKGPSYYNPRRFPERAQARRDLVLKVLFDNNLLTVQDYRAALGAPLTVSHQASLATGQHPAFMRQLQFELGDTFLSKDQLDAGVRVFTSMDIHAQRAAEAALQKKLGEIERLRQVSGLQGAMVVSDHASGGVRALVGDRQASRDGFNRAINARRPIGSLIKPILYMAALEQPQQYNLATPLQDQAVSLPREQDQRWQPQNADGKFRGQVSMLDAITFSYNLPAVHTGLAIGLPSIADMLQRLGLLAPVRQVPAMTLGAVDLTPLEVNQIYQTIANMGTYRPLYTLDAITDLDNELLWQRPQTASQRVDPAVAYLMNYALVKVAKEGTAKRLARTFKDINLAAKTGTTNDNRDTWLTGFDRYQLATIWVGKDDNGKTGLSGSTGALPVYVDFLHRMAPKSLSQPFPADVQIAHFDQTSGALMVAGCANTLSVPAITAGLPAQRLTCAGKKSKVRPPAKQKPWWQRLFD